MDAHRTLIKLFVVGLIGLLCLASNPYQAGGGADNVALAQSQFSLRHPSWINFGTSRGYNSASKYPHQGIDFATGNNPLVAAIDGTVTSVLENYNVISLAECRERGGTTVKVPERLFEIRHDSGYSLIYLHLSSFGKNPRTGGTWRVGDKIFAGEIVGISGDSGCTSGPHLHFAVKNPSGVYVNPENPSLWATFYPDDGYIDTPKNDTVVRDTVRISGWARVTRKYSPGGHPRTFYAPSSEGAIDHVEVWLLDLNGPNPNPRRLGKAIYGDSRPDVGGNFGWHFDLNTRTIPNGTYLIQARATARNGTTSVLRGELDGSTRIVVQNVEDYLVGNFDGNRTIDSVYFRESNGSWGVSLSNSCTFGAQREWTRGHGVGSQRQLIGDFDGDGKDDSAVFFNKPDAPGDWYVALSTGSGFAPATKWLSGHGYGSQNQLIGDFNGDGKDDAAVFFNKPDAQGDWYVALSTGSGFAPATKWRVGHGYGSNNQLVGDFNGDGKDDSAVFFNISDLPGDWYVALSTGSGFAPATKWRVGHGYGSQNQLIGDFNGDGKDDAAVFFNTPDSQGDWYVALSTGSGFAPATKWLSGHGYGSHSQLIGDFNGDGKDDSAVILSNGEIWVALSNGSKFATPSRWLPSNQCVASVEYHVYVPSLRR